jgi:hypothetical protein
VFYVRVLSSGSVGAGGHGQAHQADALQVRTALALANVPNTVLPAQHVRSSQCSMSAWTFGFCENERHTLGGGGSSRPCRMRSCFSFSRSSRRCFRSFRISCEDQSDSQ